jgi:hypothetical protein
MGKWVYDLTSEDWVMEEDKDDDNWWEGVKGPDGKIDQGKLKSSGQTWDKWREDVSKGGGGYKGGKDKKAEQKALPPVVPSCVHVKQFVVTLDGVTYYAGSTRSRTDEDFFFVPTLVVSLVGRRPLLPHMSTKLVETPTGFGDLGRYFPRNKGLPLVIDWPDYGAPPFRYGFTRSVHKHCVKQGIKEVVVYCVGGHGRTGTYLSSLLIEVQGLSYTDAVNFVRGAHCKKAVESKAQEAWLKNNDSWYLANINEKKIKG